MAKSDRGPTRTIQSIDRAAWILEELASGPRQLGVSELADRLGLARPTVHGLLQTLQVNGFVEQDESMGRYQLGARLLGLAYRYLDLQDLRVRSVRAAEELAQATGMAVRVGVLRRGVVVVIHDVARPGSSFRISEVGAEIPVHVSALGKAILAFEPAGAPLVDGPHGAYVKQTEFSLGPQALAEQLVEIRREGLAYERDEAVLGESSAAAAVLGRDGTVAGAIGVVADTAELRKRTVSRRAGLAVLDASRVVTRELGGSFQRPSL